MTVTWHDQWGAEKLTNIICWIGSDYSGDKGMRCLHIDMGMIQVKLLCLRRLIVTKTFGLIPEAHSIYPWWLPYLCTPVQILVINLKVVIPIDGNPWVAEQMRMSISWLSWDRWNMGFIDTTINCALQWIVALEDIQGEGPSIPESNKYTSFVWNILKHLFLAILHKHKGKGIKLQNKAKKG